MPGENYQQNLIKWQLSHMPLADFEPRTFRGGEKQQAVEAQCSNHSAIGVALLGDEKLFLRGRGVLCPPFILPIKTHCFHATACLTATG